MNQWRLRNRVRAGRDLAGRLLVRVIPEPLLSFSWHNPLFDSKYYVTRYPDVARTGVHPERHYRRHGVREGRNPNALFRTSWYLRTYPDVAAASLNPLDHYYLYGGYEGRDPSPLFRSAWYRSRNPDVREAGVNPLLHYLRHGVRERRLPSPNGSPAGAPALRAWPGTARPASPSTLPARIERVVRGPDPLGKVPHHVPVVLVIDNDYPRPDRDAGSTLTLNLVRLFQSLGYHAIYAPASGGLSIGDPSTLRALGVTVPSWTYTRSIPKLLARIGSRVDVAVLSRVDSGGVYVDDVRHHCTRAKVIFSTVDLHWLREEREAALRRDRVAMYRTMATREREIHVARMADATFVVSMAEKPLLESTAPGTYVVWCPLMIDVLESTAGYDARSGLAFVGGFLHRPNLDAIEYFLDEIWPLIRESSPDLRFHAIGPDMPESISARTDPGFVPVGHVPDLSAYLAHVRLTVAPLRYGAGAKGKVINSLAHGIPCVITPIASEGLGFTGDEIVIASDPKSFAAAVVDVYTDPVRWVALSKSGMAWVARTHSLEAGARQLIDALRTIGAPTGPAERVPSPPGVAPASS